MLSEALSTTAIRGLFECGLDDRFPALHSAWQDSQNALQAKYAADRKRMVDDEKSRLLAQHDQLQEAVRDSFVKSILSVYPWVKAISAFVTQMPITSLTPMLSDLLTPQRSEASVIADGGPNR